MTKSAIFCLDTRLAGRFLKGLGMDVKIAGAPISWGVCEAENWGYQMTPERVFGEMAELGLTGTEFGPYG